jgi:hypothetical protein
MPAICFKVFNSQFKAVVLFRTTALSIGRAQALTSSDIVSLWIKNESTVIGV